MIRGLIWILAALFSITFSLLAWFPASWLPPILESQSKGRLSLSDPQGTLWQGSGLLVASSSPTAPMSPLLPGRFEWKLSPMIAIGLIDIELKNSEALSQPFSITGNIREWEITPAALKIPSEYLVALGAPLNTIKPAGNIRLNWQTLRMELKSGALSIFGLANVDLQNISSRLSPVKPLGSYDLSLDWRGTEASMNLETRQGPLLLDGKGSLGFNQIQFSGTAQPEAGHEQQLANFVNLLGIRRTIGDREVVALEFR